MDPQDITKPRLLLFATGAVSVAFGFLHFATRATTAGPAEVRVSYDLVGLSMIFAGLVTISVAWMALSPQIFAGFATLFGIYQAGHGWILLLAGISWARAVTSIILAIASLLAAWLAWAGRDGTGGDNQT